MVNQKLGNVGNDLSGSYTGGGTGGTAAIYSNIPTTTNGSGSGMQLRVVTEETINLTPSVTLTPLAGTTLAAIGTYTVGVNRWDRNRSNRLCSSNSWGG